ncbi:MAG: hypothetical protein LBJ41_00795 [Treponema sp.]|jgi:H+/Cl- antiporter ClcA|nr:hypothetical protein [Treponema sp.]
MKGKKKVKRFLWTGMAAIFLITLFSFISGCSGGAFTDPGLEAGDSDGTSFSSLLGT